VSIVLTPPNHKVVRKQLGLDAEGLADRIAGLL